MPSRPIKRVALVANDAGGARALFPVAEELQSRGIHTDAILAGPAVKICREEAPQLRILAAEDDSSVDALAQQLIAFRTDTLLSASGLYNLLEHNARLAARSLGLPVIALLDSWLNYTERFEREIDGAIVESRPDCVCAIDALTREGIIAAGFDRGSVFLTGHPDLERTARLCRAGSERERRSFRREAGLSEEGLLIVFFSDPFYIGPALEYYSGPGAIMHPDGRPIFGYTVRDVLPAILRELEAAMRAAKISCDFVVRPHPWEHDGALRQIIDEASLERVRVRLEHRSTSIDWIQAADVLMGMMTIALLHAALAGKPAISVELGLIECGQEDPCVANLLGYTHGIFDDAALCSACQLIARREWSALKTQPIYPLPLEGAARGVADVLTRKVAADTPAPTC